jgi:hypothetical protein
VTCGPRGIGIGSRRFSSVPLVQRRCRFFVLVLFCSKQSSKGRVPPLERLRGTAGPIRLALETLAPVRPRLSLFFGRVQAAAGTGRARPTVVGIVVQGVGIGALCDGAHGTGREEAQSLVGAGEAPTRRTVAEVATQTGCHGDGHGMWPGTGGRGPGATCSRRRRR